MIYADLTPEQKTEYLEDDHKCPFCTSKNYNGERIERSGQSATQCFLCNECGREWIDTLTLTGVELGEQTCHECDGIVRVGDEVTMTDDGPMHTRCGHSHDLHTVGLEADAEEITDASNSDVPTVS